MVPTRTVRTIEELRALVGQELGVGPWLEITQARVDAFADVTGDHQYIHVDPKRAAATPFGGTIAHGYYTLSLGPRFLEEILAVEGFDMAINYGLDRVRFPSPLPVGDRVRMRLAIERVDEISGGVQMKTKLTFERAGGGDDAKPVCVAESLTRFLGG